LLQASSSLDSPDGPPAASSAFGNGPQELLGLSSAALSMSTASSLPRTLSHSSASGQQLHHTNLTPDYDFPQDLDLGDAQASEQHWRRYQINASNSRNDNDNVADPMQRLASAEPEQLPWSGMHLNGRLPSHSQRETDQHLAQSSMNLGMSQQRSLGGSHANHTDEGYYTISQPDMHSIYSGNSGHGRHIRPGQSVPRSIPSTQQHSVFPPYQADPDPRPAKYQITSSPDQQQTSPVQLEPHSCSEPGCTFTCKTQSDFK
jgi:hypothetical protein